MPLYDYRCPKCKKTKEYLLPILHKTPKHCNVFSNRVWSNLSVAFKGSGFTKAVHQIELGDGRRGTVGEDGFERIKRLDPDARLVKV